MMKKLYLIALTLLVFIAPSFAQSKRVWTVAEILAERQIDESKGKVKYCSGGAFKPCVCASYVTKLVQYRPAVKECKGRAAVILSGKYLNVYSVVVRDVENKDRWPVQGVAGCTKYETDVLGLNKCSVFKVQDVIGVENTTDLGDAEVHCLGASGYSTLFTKVRRITAKLQDIPGSNADPLVRLCLVGPTKPLN